MKSKENAAPIPIIDVFAGPGGLGEGFSSEFGNRGRKFEIKLSIEKDEVAHKTLRLRAFFRQFPFGDAPEEYYKFLRGAIDLNELAALYPKEWKAADHEAQCCELGKDEVDGLIESRISGARNWVLIGGPPCQAYSLVGRATMTGKGLQRDGESDEDFDLRAAEKVKKFESDHRHTLYREYLKIIAKFWPSVFVMENVKGILSSKLNGNLIFPTILKDLREPAEVFSFGNKRHSYTIHSFVVPASKERCEDLLPQDFLIHAENYGVSQTRHRVILLGVRDDIECDDIGALVRESSRRTVFDTIDDLPNLTSGVSKKGFSSPYEALSSMQYEIWWPQFLRDPEFREVAAKMNLNLKKCLKQENRGASFLRTETVNQDPWFYDNRLRGVCNHETRSHIPEDLWRYFFAASFAQIEKESPKLRDFPPQLYPKHRNINEAVTGTKFGDRFRVQLKWRPGTTVISHISKDGHYFIHYDHRQYRSFTVREAARIQSFPDNYFFEGPRTEQFHQVGNAVPPYLAYQLSEIVWRIFNK